MENREWMEKLEVLEPALYVHDELKVIYINEAYEEALNEKEPELSAQYTALKEANPDYVTRLRRLPVTIEFMKEYAALKRDSFILDLIERKEPMLRAKGELYEMSSFDAFKNMFLARHPECRNVYKVKKRLSIR